MGHSNVESCSKVSAALARSARANKRKNLREISEDAKRARAEEEHTLENKENADANHTMTNTFIQGKFIFNKLM